ncbi:MerR family transcriptional regulator [Methanoculleus sp. FWC-SCC1]|uniref:MerR family transcriptional regulator n=1 Tax=Methanoculleus frigidifontis TaxID=2584085 RepID=A0ABT8M9F7_9EURY|nr:MerR family transcriptional regulator [Methanoculleus sp. FWC-SCC1]MDN7024577.1 MerR family transcriptional regulator [Methanoculleus sp. FWC-SCC1]
MAPDRISIGMFSLVTHLSPKALRLYDEKGLLVPAERDICTGYRYYTYAQIERAVRIKNLLWLGFSLDDAATLLCARDQGDAGRVRSLFAVRLVATEREIRRLHAVQEVLQQQDPLSGGFRMSVTEPEIKEIPALRVISRRERGVYQETIPRLIGELCTFLEAGGGQQPAVKMAGPVMFICHDEEYRETDADIEIAIPVSGRVSVDTAAIEVRSLPAARVVSVLYTGPYPGVATAYEKAFAYLGSHGLVPAGPTRELYFNDPTEVPETELLTEVHVPVREE